MPDPLHDSFNAEFRRRAQQLHDSLPDDQRRDHEAAHARFHDFDHFAAIKRITKGDDDLAADTAIRLLYGNGDGKSALFDR